VGAGGTERRVGLYGGTFDPIHHGHLIAARSVAEQLELDRMVFIPAAQPPHKVAGDLTPFDDRSAMVELAICGEPGFAIDCCERQLPGPNYTLRTVEQVREQLGSQAQVFWLIGADSLADLSTWYRVAQLTSACRIITAARPGWQAPDLGPLESVIGPEALVRLRGDILATPLCDIASRDIRARVAAGRSIRYLVPEAVREYIEDHGLYR
jgi:nicotinate-nucleotide adenylyltransferase